MATRVAVDKDTPEETTTVVLAKTLNAQLKFIKDAFGYESISDVLIDVAGDAIATKFDAGRERARGRVPKKRGA